MCHTSVVELLFTIFDGIVSLQTLECYILVGWIINLHLCFKDE